MSKPCGGGKHYIEFIGGDASIECEEFLAGRRTTLVTSGPVACQCILGQAVSIIRHGAPKLAAALGLAQPISDPFAISQVVEANTIKSLGPHIPGGVPGTLIVAGKLCGIAEKFGLTLDMEVSRAQPPAWGTFLSTKAPNEIFFDRLSIIGVTKNAAGELFNERVIKMISHLESNGFKLVEHEEEYQFDIAGDKQKLTYRRLMATSDLWNPKQREGDVVAHPPSRYTVDAPIRGIGASWISFDEATVLPSEAFKGIYEIGSSGRFAMKTSEDISKEIRRPREPDPGLEYMKKLAGGK